MKAMLKTALTALILVLMMTDFCKAQDRPLHYCPVSVLSSSDEKLAMFEELDAYKAFIQDIENFKKNTVSGILIFKYNPETNIGRLLIAGKTSKGFNCTIKGLTSTSEEIKINPKDIAIINDNIKAVSAENYYANCSDYSENPNFNMAIIKNDNQVKAIYLSDFEGFFSVDKNYNSNFNHVMQILEASHQYLYR